MKRYRNNSRDVRHYLFQYVDIPWQKNSKIRQLVVKATSPNGRTIQLAILATDTQRNAAEIITIIFRRWIQENDFKYLQMHYGINQIISYDTIDYKEFVETLTDKKVTSGTYKALQYDKAQQEKRLKDLLLKKHLREKNIALANNRLEDVDSAIKALKEKNGEVEIKLYPSAYLEPKIRKIMEEFLYDISNKNMIMPDGSNRKMTLCLVTNETFQLANTNPNI